jgi:hypothetical protein
MSKKISIRERIVTYMKHIGASMTAEEIAAGAGAHVVSVKPRLTELSDLGKVRKTGATKIGMYGKQIATWELL